MMEQGSPEWIAARVGKVTASRVADIIAKTKSGPSASRANYMAELIAERLTGQPAAKFTNAAMEHGTNTEAEARAAYSFYTGTDVELVGLVDHPHLPMCGASPDGLIGDGGLVEIKCPNTATHIETLLGCKVPSKYETQMLWQMECTDRHWCDFVSYDPRLPERMRLFVKRFHWDESRVFEIGRDVRAFMDELDAKMIDLAAKFPAESVAA